MNSGKRRYGDDESPIDQNKGKGCAKKMGAQLEKEPETRKIEKFEKKLILKSQLEI